MTIPALDLAAITYSPKNNVIGGGAGQALWLLGATKSLGSGNYTFLGDANDSSQAYADGPYRIGILMLAGQLSLGSGNQTIAGSAATAADSATLVYGINLQASDLNISGPPKGGVKITGSAVSTATANDFIGGIAVQIGSEIRGGDQNSYISGSSTANHANTFAFGIVVRGGSSITLGAGNDTLVGTANIGSGRAFGIGNIGVLGGSIFTGEGNDKVISQATVGGQMVDGFFGGIEIDLGAGNDTLSGFGNAKVDGGSGTDTLDLSQYALATFTISKDAVTQAVVLAKAGGATMHLAHFESFVFSDGVFSFATLPASTFG